MPAFSLKQIAELTNPETIQTQIDGLIAGSPHVSDLLEYARYVPQGRTANDIAPDATHKLSLTGQSGEGVFIVVKVKPPFSWVLDLILARI